MFPLFWGLGDKVFPLFWGLGVALARLGDCAVVTRHTSPYRRKNHDNESIHFLHYLFEDVLLDCLDDIVAGQVLLSARRILYRSFRDI